MDSGLLAKRYATALNQYSSELSQGEKCLEDARRLIASLPVLGEYMGKPLPAKTKMDLLSKAVPDMCYAFEKFLSLVVSHHRETSLRRILKSYIAEYKKARGIVDATLTVASQPSQQLLDTLVHLAQESTGADKVDIEVEIDDSLIGGFVFKAGDKRLDSSVKRQLRDLRKAFETNNKRII